MARPKSQGPIREAAVAVRLVPIERRFLAAAAAHESAQRDLGASGLPLSAFLRAGGIERARRVLGISLAEFEAQETRETTKRTSSKKD